MFRDHIYRNYETHVSGDYFNMTIAQDITKKISFHN